MRYEEKLRREMILKGFNQQRLARASGVSDSEVSRILAGKSQPGLENALKLARAVGVSLDYLADDTRDAESRRVPPSDPWTAEALELVRELGPRLAVQLLLAVRTIGHEAALRRLFGLDAATGGPPPAMATAAEEEDDGAASVPLVSPTMRPVGGSRGAKVSR